MPFTARQLDEVPVQTDSPPGRVYDVELPYRRLGRCRMSDTVGVNVGTSLDQVAAALSIYETRNGTARDRGPTARRGRGPRSAGRSGEDHGALGTARRGASRDAVIY
jgi:hypothetical protein